MSDVTVEQAERLKRKLETDIHTLVLKFTSETGLVVDHIEAPHAGDVSLLDGGTERFYGRTSVEVRLP